MKVVGRQTDLGSMAWLPKRLIFQTYFLFIPLSSIIYPILLYVSSFLKCALGGKNTNVTLLKNSEDGEIASACNSLGRIPGEGNIHD